MNKYTNENYRIYSTGKNEMGRTVFTEYRIRNGIVKSIYPNCEICDSEEDRKNAKEMDKRLEEIHRDFLDKSARSEESAKRIILTAAA